MGRRPSDAAVKDAQIKLKRGEFVLGMVQTSVVGKSL